MPQNVASITWLNGRYYLHDNLSFLFKHAPRTPTLQILRVLWNVGIFLSDLLD
uniref:Uncharacterized protein n=1 Tax=Anguilla anguilla TaxID=7936 RepID=A0A0E9SUK0_ANGAN